MGTDRVDAGLQGVLDELFRHSPRQQEGSLGIVKWFDQEKGYGFIKPDDGGDDIFFHHRTIKVLPENGKRSLPDGQRVEFWAEMGQQGLRASDVRISFAPPPDME